MTQHQPRLLIVYPGLGNIFYETLARRLAAACAEGSLEATLCAAAELGGVDKEQLECSTVALVNPSECAIGLGNVEEFFSRISVARKKVMVLAEAVENRWFKVQFQLPIRYDAVIDVGFVSQKEKVHDPDVPYSFLFNGPTQEEKQKIERTEPSRRSIPWAFVGHRRDDRFALAAELVEKLDPRGFLFLPNPGTGVVRTNGKIGPAGLEAVLSRTKYYVWMSHHTFMYYESFRFIEALLAGAVPCKIDVGAKWEGLGIPGIFPSAGSFCKVARSEDSASMLDTAKDYYLSRGLLVDHLEEVLQDV